MHVMFHMKARFVNLTPHLIRLETDEGDVFEIEPSGEVARVSTEDAPLGWINEVLAISRAFGSVTGLPEAKQHSDVVYLVSSMVLAACPLRMDIAAPDTGPSAVRNADGTLDRVTRLVINPRVS